MLYDEVLVWERLTRTLLLLKLQLI